MGSNNGSPYTRVYQLPAGSDHLDGTVDASCMALASTAAPGLDYHPPSNTMVGWTGDDQVHLYQPETHLCTTLSGFAGGPTATGGINGRWRYSPTLRAFVASTAVDQNHYAFCLPDEYEYPTGR